MIGPDIELLDLRPLSSVSDRHPAAIAVGEVRTGEATLAFYLALDGSVWLPPGVWLSEAAAHALRQQAQATQLVRLMGVEARAAWHAEGHA